MKNVIKILFFVFCVMLVSASYANAQIVDPFGIPGLNLPFQSQIEMRLCLITRLFCGTFALMVITITIFIIGIMMLNHRLHWSTAMLIIAGIVTLTEAPNIATFFGTENSIIFIANPMCNCKCANANQLPWPFAGMDLGIIGNWLGGNNSSTCL